MATKQCDHCGLRDVALSKCAGCHCTRYCGRVCQKAAWRSHKPLCGMPTPGEQTSSGFELNVPVSDEVLTHQAKLMAALEILDPGKLRRLEEEDAETFARMKVTPTEKELLEETAQCKADSAKHARLGQTFAAANRMHDCAIVYVRAGWWLEASKIMARCKVLLAKHVEMHGSDKLVQDLSGYTELHDAVHSNFAMITARLNPVMHRERLARQDIVAGFAKAMATPRQSPARLDQLRRLLGMIQSERVVLQRTGSWTACVDIDMQCLSVCCEIAKIHDREHDVALAVCMQECVARGLSVLMTHKDQFGAHDHDERVKLFQGFDADLEEDIGPATLPLPSAASGGRAATR